MNCLDIIDFKPCDGSGGITIESYVEVNPIIFAHLANEQEKTGATYESKVLSVSKQKIWADISTAEADIAFNQVAESPKFIPNWNYVDAKGGVRILNSQPSPQTRIVITQIHYLPRDVQDFNITIDDGQGSPNTFPISGAVLNQVGILELEYKSSSKQVKIYSNDGYFGVLTNGDQTCYTCNGGINGNISIHGLDQYQQNGNVMVGFYPVAYLTCDTENVICQSLKNAVIKARVQEAISYQVGLKVYERFLLSSRMNDTTTNIDKEAVETYKDILQAKYNEIVHGSKKIKGLIELITTDLNRGDFCIRCNAVHSTAWGVV